MSPATTPQPCTVNGLVRHFWVIEAARTRAEITRITGIYCSLYIRSFGTALVFAAIPSKADALPALRPFAVTAPAAATEALPALPGVAALVAAGVGVMMLALMLGALVEWLTERARRRRMRARAWRTLGPTIPPSRTIRRARSGWGAA